MVAFSSACDGAVAGAGVTFIIKLLVALLPGSVLDNSTEVTLRGLSIANQAFEYKTSESVDAIDDGLSDGKSEGKSEGVSDTPLVVLVANTDSVVGLVLGGRDQLSLNKCSNEYASPTVMINLASDSLTKWVQSNKPTEHSRRCMV
jgi:hypothetical protein